MSDDARLDLIRTYLRALEAEALAHRQPAPIASLSDDLHDALLTLSGGCSVGLLRQGPMLSAANLRFRLRTVERLGWGQTPWLTLVLTDSEQDLRRAVRALADPSQHPTTFVACEKELIAGGASRPGRALPSRCQSDHAEAR